MSEKCEYTMKPWLRAYPSGIPETVDIPLVSIGEVFENVCKKFGGKTAIYFYGKKISYDSLNEKINRMCNALTGLGIRKGDRCALLLLNTPEYVISFLALAKLGVAIVPISPVYVSSEAKHQLEDSGAKHLICHDILYEVIEKTGIRLKNVVLARVNDSLPLFIRLIGKSILKHVYQKMAMPEIDLKGDGTFHSMKELIDQNSPKPPKIDVDPAEDTLTLHYTGGTTGAPKGVILTHFNTLAGQIQFRSFYPSFCREASEVLMGYMPFYHQGGQCNALLRSTLLGNTLVIVTNPEIDDVINLTVKCKATSFVGAPALYEILKDYKKTSRIDWKNLKAVMAGGDALSEFTEKDFRDRTGISLLDFWGQTECSDLIIGNPVTRKKKGSVGIPFPNVKAAILSPDSDEYVPVGELGELVVSSPSTTSKGYWRNRGATRDCECAIDGVRWWRTGDLGRMDEEGYFYIYDRKRDLIKYKGLRVYAREVEEVLRLHPQIKEVGVIGVKDVKVGQNVKAFVVIEADARGVLSEVDVVNYCRGKLAAYKVPKMVEFVSEIPKTDMGKVSRRDIREASEGEESA